MHSRLQGQTIETQASSSLEGAPRWNCPDATEEEGGTRSVEVWLGHATALMRLCPSLLSVFDKIYRFIRLGGDRRIPLWPAVRTEIEMATNLVWLCQFDLRSGFVKQVDMGDSAAHGYAMMTRSAPDHLLRSACRFREKWRYIPLPDSLKDIVLKKGCESYEEVVYEFSALEDGTRSVNPARS